MSSTDAAGYLFIGSERQRIVAPVQPSEIGEEYETPIVLESYLDTYMYMYITFDLQPHK